MTVENIVGFRLSPQQRRVWALREPAGEARSICLVRLRGGVDAGALRAALRGVVAKYEIFRTAFRRRPGIRYPLQVVLPDSLLDWREEALSLDPLAAGAREEAGEALFAAPAPPFDLDGGPVLRATLLRVAPDEHLLSLALPALCADLATLHNLARETAAAYGRGAVDGDEEPLQYAQIAEWQNGFLEDEEGGAARERWHQVRSSFADGPLPFERRAAQGPGGTAAVRLGLGLTETLALEDLARSAGTSVSSLLLAVWSILLWRLGGRTGRTLGCVFPGRPYQELAGVMGPLAKMVPVTVPLTSGHRFREAVTEAALAVDSGLDGLEYFDWDDESGGAQDAPAVGFLYEEIPALGEHGGVAFSFERAEAEIDRCKLALSALLGESLSLELRYDGARFAAADMEGLTASLRALLDHALREPEARVGELDIVGAAERARLLGELSGGEFAWPATATVYDLFAEQARRHPQRPAVVYEADRLSYGDLAAHAGRLARALAARGVGPESRVALFLPRSADLVVGLLGTFASGAAYVPLDPGLPAERLGFLLRASGSRVLVTHRAWRDRVPPAELETLCLDELAGLPAGEDPEPLAGSAGLENLAYVIFTSGSTGEPKGVAVEHRQLAHYVHAVRAALDLPDGGAYALVSTFAADLGHTSLFPALCGGGCLHVIAEERAADPFALSEYFARFPVDCLKIVPSHLEALQQFTASQGVLPRQRLILGGEALRRGLVDKVEHSQHAPSCLIFNHYGPTETTVGVLAYRLGAAEAEEAPTVPIGRPLGGSRIYIVDPDMAPVPVGVPGELLVGGPGVSRGYLGRPHLTAERFLPDPFSGVAGARLYRTGDLVRFLLSGDVEFLGRVDHQVKVRGFRIELGEIEAALLRHPAVRETVAVTRQEGDGGVRLVAYLTLASVPVRPKVEELREFLRQVLPDAMVPSFFVVLDRLPLTANGKVDRRALPPPDAVRPDLAREYVAPSTPVEQALAEIWAEVLRLEHVGVEDNFFALGGDSLHSVRVLALAKARGLDFTLQHLFQHQTIARLASAVGTEAPGAARPLRRPPFSLISEADRRLIPAGIEDAYPLSRLQFAMLFHMEETPESRAYHNFYSFHIRAPLDLEALHRAVQRFVAVYAFLRTSFHMTEFSEPLQLVHSTAELPIDCDDIRHLTYAEQEEVLREFMADARARLFDLRRPPLWRFHLHRRTNETFQFNMVECHPVSDGWSMNATLAEILGTYRALLRGEEPPPVPPVEVSYADFVALERRAIASEEHRRFWADRLADPTLVRLPRDRRPSANGGDSIWRFNTPLSAELYDGLRRLAQQAEVPLRSVGLAAHLKVLSLLSGQRDILTSLLTDARPEEVGGDRLRGLCFNTVPFRLDLGDSTWMDLLRRTFREESELQPFRRYPLSEIQKSWGQETLIETFYAHLNFRSLEILAESDDLELMDYGSFTLSETTFTLCVYLWIDPVPSHAALILTSDAHILGEDRVRSIYGHYRRVLEAMVAEPHERHHAVLLLSPSEREQVLCAWNATDRERPWEFAHRRFEAQVALRSDSLAAVDRDERVTYAELNRRANRLAHAFVAHGAGPERIVALALERGIGLITCLLAIFKAGAVYMPLDPRYPVLRQRQILERSGAILVVAKAGLDGGVREAAAGLAAEEVPPVLDLDALLQEPRPETDLPVRCLPDNLAYVLFTSGSTGVPKAAMLHHRGMLNHLLGKIEMLRLGTEDVMAQTASLSFDISVWQMLVALVTGGVVWIFEDEVAKDPSRLLAAVAARKITVFESVPSLLDAMLRDEILLAEGGLDLSALRWLPLTGEALTPDLCERWLRAFPHVPMVNSYGPTECSDNVAHAFVTTPPPPDQATIPIGDPLANTRLYVLDRWLQPVPVGVTGELYVAGIALGRGYLHEPGLTARVFLPDPFATSPGGRLYRTGDLVRYEPGEGLHFLGRIDHQVKLRGFRIELEEVQVVLAQHPQILHAAVIVREDSPGQQRLVAYVVPAEEQKVGSAELRRYVEARLPAYMVPAAFVALPELPRTAHSKLDRSRLPVPEPEAGEERGASRQPLSHLEELLAGYWAKVLERDQVGPDDNFFELGGHSLLVAQIVFKIRETFGIELPMATLFAKPTLRELATVVEEARRSQESLREPPLVRVPRGEPLPQSFNQRRLWLVDRLARGSQAYNLREAILLRGALDRPALERSFAELVRRHESLRTTFGVRDDRPVQIIYPPAPVAMPLVDLSALGREERLRELRQMARAETRWRFDLETGPLLRLALVRLAAEEHGLLMTLHHIIGDAWSLNLIFEEVSAFYTTFSRGEPSPLPEPELQYADYAAWQTRLLDGDTREVLLGYWRERLAGAPPLLQLPTDRPRPREQAFRGASRYLLLSPDLAEKLEVLARREEATLFTVLLAAFKILLRQRSGQSDIVVGTDVLGRDRPETAGMLGFFINELVLRTDLSGDPSFRELLATVKATCLGAFLHQDIPYVDLVEALRPERNLSYMPLFQVSLGLLYGVPERPKSGEVSMARLELFEQEWSRGDLTLNLMRAAEGLECWALYDSALFDGETIDRMLVAFRAVLEAVVERTEVRLGELEGVIAAVDCAHEEREDEDFAEVRRRKLGQLRRRSERLLSVGEPEVATS